MIRTIRADSLSLVFKGMSFYRTCPFFLLAERYSAILKRILTGNELYKVNQSRENMENDNRLRVGVITSPHGVHGEVNVFPTTDDPQRFKKLKKVYINKKKETLECEIESVKFFKNMVILKFSGMDDRNEIEKYRQCDLLIDREDAVDLGEDEYFICDLIGLDIVDEKGNKIGVLQDVMTSAANDVYVVEKNDGKELLIPAIRDCILETDLEKKIIKVHLLPGL